MRETEAMRWWVLAVMSLSIFMVFVDGTVVNTALPAISRGLGASTSELQWVADGYILILAGLLLVGGTIGDRFGRRRFLTLGMVIFGAASVGAALSTNVESLIFFRGAQGVGAALVMPATLSILTAVFPRQERAKAIAIWTAMGGLGAAFGPALGGYLVDEINWNAVFWLHLPTVGLALLGMLIVPESKASRRVPLDISGGILVTGGLLSLVFGIIQGNELGWSSFEVIGAFVLAAVLLGAFISVELRSSAPMLPLHFFKQRDFAGAVFIIGIAFFAMFGVFFLLTQFFQIVQGRSAFEAGSLIVPAALGMMVSSKVAGVLSQSVGPKILIVSSMVLILLGMIAFSQMSIDSGVPQLIGSIFLFGFGLGIGMPALTDTVMAAVPVDDAGIGSAVNDVGRELGGALGIAITGSIVNGLYKSNLDEALVGSAVPAEAAELAREGIVAASLAASTLPAEAAVTLTAAANTAFTDGIITAVFIGAVFMLVAVILAAATIPWKMRAAQAAEKLLQPIALPEVLEVPALEVPLGAMVTVAAATGDHPHAPDAPFLRRFVSHCYGVDFIPWLRCNG